MLESGEVCGIVRQLRRMVIETVPNATEEIKFGALSYFSSDSSLRSIGANFCMIELRGGEVRLSFLHGAELADPHHLLRESGKAKRFVPIPSRDAVIDHRLIDLVRESAEWVEME